jgi:hypothetical protein
MGSGFLGDGGASRDAGKDFNEQAGWSYGASTVGLIRLVANGDYQKPHEQTFRGGGKIGSITTSVPSRRDECGATQKTALRPASPVFRAGVVVPNQRRVSSGLPLDRGSG